MKKWIIAIFVLGLLLGGANFALAKEKIEIYFSYSLTCPHCAAEEKFLDGLEKNYPEININKLSTHEKEDIDLLKKLYQDYEVPSEFQGAVPITFIKERYFLGFNDKIGEDIEGYVLELIKEIPSEPQPQPGKTVVLPFIGEINLSEFSPLFLAVVLGTLDGFNVCSLGALVLILGLVLALRSRIKIFIYGATFILTTAFVYGILIIFWYKLFSLLTPYLRTMEILIGFLGIGGGIYFLRQFLKFRKQGPTCEIGADRGIISQFSSKIQESIKKPGNIIFILGSIFLFAAVITIIEFPCSAFVPVAFAGVLSQSQLPALQYLLYIAIFVFFYLLDELIIFLIAVLTATIWLASSKFVTWITLIEGIVLFLLGIYYLFGA